ncbi:hypothetical protein TrLO_g2182, partial [Triparma laevis f. longispina]
MSLAVSPESAISFTLSRNNSSATKSIMSLTAPPPPATTTTATRRCSTSSSRWGPPALESSKDKFLIQSCPVAKSFYDETKALGAKDVAE